MIFAK